MREPLVTGKPPRPASSDRTPVPGQNLSATDPTSPVAGMCRGLSRAEDHYRPVFRRGAGGALVDARIDAQHAIGLCERRLLRAIDEGDLALVRDLSALAIALLQLVWDRATAIAEQRVAQPQSAPSPGLTYTPPVGGGR